MDERVHVVAGNSEDTSKYWYKIFKGIKDYGFKVYCVNPKISNADTTAIYPDLDSLPEKGEVLILVARPDVSAQLVWKAVELG
jgi:predicted CoA-binding protein